MATRLTLTDGLGFLAALLEAACHAAGSGCSGVSTGSWECQEMIVRMHTEQWLYTLRRGIGLFVWQRPELFLKVSRATSKIFGAISKISKVSSKTLNKLSKTIQRYIPPKDTHIYFQTSSSHFGSNVGPFTW